MTHRAPLLIALAALLLPACATPQAAGGTLPGASVVIRSASGEHAVRVEIAEAPAAQRRGLRGRDHLPDGSGMLFLFDRDRTGGFWMHQVRIPLEIAFIDSGGTIVRVMRMEPCQAAVAFLCPSYRPGAPYRMALEVPGGWLTARGIGPGDRVTVRRDGPRPHAPSISPTASPCASCAW